MLNAFADKRNTLVARKYRLECDSTPEDGMDESAEKAFSEGEVKQRLRPNCRMVLRRRLDSPQVQDGGWKGTLMVVNHGRPSRGVPRGTILISRVYAFVIVKLVTHSAKGITEKDFALAR
jgi:4a-hydroxytetrahydrobiopterin dehydratase